jgi:hypothetical protein
MYWRRTALALCLPSGLGGCLVAKIEIDGLIFFRILLGLECAAIISLLDILMGTVGFHLNRNRLRWMVESGYSFERTAMVAIVCPILGLMPGPLLSGFLFMLAFPENFYLAISIICLSLTAGASVVLSECLIAPIRGPDGSVAEDPLVGLLCLCLVGLSVGIILYKPSNIFSLAVVTLTVTLVCVAWFICRKRIRTLEVLEVA